ncbi:MAG: alpha-galactosidase [Lentisphaeria bacterium]|nr:alpha-galactosidase [Lentisphaeria bacterium]
MYCRKTFEELLDVKSPVKPFSFSYEGTPCDLSTIPCVIEEGKDGKRTMIYEVVPGTVRLILDMVCYSDFPVIEYTPYFENISDKDSGILSNISVLDYEGEDPYYFGTRKVKKNIFGTPSRLSIRYYLGAQANGVDYIPQRKDIFAYRKVSDKLELESLESRCSSDYLPFFSIDNDQLNGFDLAVGWTGAWKFSAEKEVQSKSKVTELKSRIRCGMKRAAFRLHPGEKVMQPGILLHFRENKSIRDSQNEFRRFMLEHHSPRNSRGELFKPPICLTFWGGLETDKMIARIQRAREKNLPYEEVWMDAGWMGTPGPCPHFLEESEQESDWPKRVGSWQINTWAHPRGLKPVSDAAHKAGMRFLVWFESLRVHSGCGGKILTEHPEWLLGDKKAFAEGKEVDFLLNIGIPEARKYLFDTLCGIIQREGIDDYREDFNISPQTHLASGDEPDRIGVTEMKFVEACYILWEELRERFPDLFIDNCASGGRRLDYKMASLSFPLCQSDLACCELYEEECLQLENFSLDNVLPLHGTLNWGPEDPYHMASGMGGGIGCKIWNFNGRDPKENEDDAFHRKMLEWAKLLRDIHMKGDIYPLTEEPENDWMKWAGEQIHDPKENCGMVQIFRRKRSPEADFQLKLAGLDPEALYEAEFFTGEKKKLSGKEFASLTIHLAEPRSFQIIRYARMK